MGHLFSHKAPGVYKILSPPPRNQRPKWRGKEGKREGKREGIGEGKGKCREGSGQVGKEIGIGKWKSREWEGWEREGREGKGKIARETGRLRGKEEG